MTVTANFTAAVHRKLATFSAGHAATAYLGALKGYRYVHAAIRDPQVQAVVAAVLREGQAGLAACYGPETAGGPAELAGVLRRYANAALDDPVDRVARDPLRKLAANERIIGSAVRAEEAGISPEALALVAAAALCYLRREGDTTPVADILTRVSALSVDRGFGARVLSHYLDLAPGTVPGNALVDLDRRRWATSTEAAPQLQLLQ
jgi:mannitol-1-phosphate 5-dehydrogenase